MDWLTDREKANRRLAKSKGPNKVTTIGGIIFGICLSMAICLPAVISTIEDISWSEAAKSLTYFPFLIAGTALGFSIGMIGVLSSKE